MYILNIDALKSMNPIPSVNSEIIVGGYYQMNDNGGGTFIWKTSAPLPPEDGGIIIYHNTDSTGWFERVIMESELHINWFGAKGDGIYDDADPLQKGINYLGQSGGTIILGSGESYTWKSIPKIPRNITGQLVISGYGATIKLTDTGDCFCEVNKIADYDLFKNITLQGFNLDGNNIGGRSQVLFGTYRNGVSYQKRLNFNNITIKDILVFNVPTDPTLVNHRIPIYISSYHPTGGETQTTIKNITIDNVHLEGGNAGILISGNGTVADNTNVYLDEIYINNCSHKCIGFPTAFFTSSNMQIGQNSTGGRIRIKNFYGENAGDNGIEINGFMDAIVENTTIKNAFNLCYYTKNFAPVADYLNQSLTYQNTRSIIGDHTGRAFGLSGSNTFGTINIFNQTLEKTGSFQTGSYIAINLQPGINDKKLVAMNIDGYSIDWAVSGLQTTNAFPSVFWFAHADTDATRLILNNIRVNIHGTWDNPGGFNFSPRIMMFDANFDVSAENITFNWDVVAAQSSILGPIRIGRDGTDPFKFNAVFYNLNVHTQNLNVTTRTIDIGNELRVLLDDAHKIKINNAPFTINESGGGVVISTGEQGPI